MNKWMALATAVAVSLLVGCGSSQNLAQGAKADTGAGAKKGSASVTGSYVFRFTDEVEKQLRQDEDALRALRPRADAGDPEARRLVAGIPKDAQSERRLLAGIKLKLSGDKSFVFQLLDRTTGRPREAAGTYTVDDSGAKLTLTFATIDGKKAEGPDAKALSMTFDDQRGTVTGDTGGGPKLVMQKR